MSLYITEFAGVGSGVGSSHPRGLLASQSVVVDGTSTACAALNANTTLVRLIADEDCNVAISADPDAAADAVIALVADVETFVHVDPSMLLAVITRA